MKKRNKAKEDVCEEADDWCFVCKDGGDLIICDKKGCLKVYHAKCVKKDKDEISPETGTRWFCDRHTCFSCRKSTKIYCFCCPNAVCGRCNSATEFVQVRGNGGFCDECVKLIILIEEKAVYDSDGEKLDFDDRNTQECLFKEYWEIVKERKGLTLENVYHADARLKKGKSYNGDCGPIAISSSAGTDEPASVASDEDDEVKSSSGKRSRGRRSHISESDESDENDLVRGPRGKRKRPKNGFQEFEGWGSKPLIHFLNSIGIDTNEELSRIDVDAIISRYIKEKDLCDRVRRKRVCCDEKLYAIFRKKTFNRNKMYLLLEPHFMEMVMHSEEDEKDDGEEIMAKARGRTAKRAGKKQKASGPKRKLKEKEVVPKVQEVPKVQQVSKVQESSFAAINAHNLKLVYLRRSFIEELLKHPQTAEGKIVGSFVKVKRGPTYNLIKSAYQLLQVTGLKQGATANNDAEILLEVSNLSKPISIKQLADTDLSEEECDDLRERVENGNVKKLTVEDLQQKATSLHEVITKLSIEKEIALLQHMIDQANEKGWRREPIITKEQYIERKALLKTPSEQERRLKQVPKVMPEAIKLNPLASSSPSLADDSESDEEENGESPKSVPTGLQIVRESPL